MNDESEIGIIPENAIEAVAIATLIAVRSKIRQLQAVSTELWGPNDYIDHAQLLIYEEKLANWAPEVDGLALRAPLKGDPPRIRVSH